MTNFKDLFPLPDVFMNELSQRLVMDTDCTINTPVTFGKPAQPVYGKGYIFSPRIPGKTETQSDLDSFLPRLFPLEDYDMIIVLFSGGKDSLAAYLRLLEWGVPKDRIELWHHDIDGGHPTRRMDWPVTSAYVKAFAEAEGVRLRKSWRVNGFWGEVYRIGASWPIQYDADDGSIAQVPLTERQIRSEILREQILQKIDIEAATEELKSYGLRYKFPAKNGSLRTRWCSAYLKIMVSESVIRGLDQLHELENYGKRGMFPAKGSPQSGRWCSGALKMQVQGSVTKDLEKTKANTRILVVSGERRGESSFRTKLNEMELHRTNAEKKAKRIVHHWRPVIDYSERDVWEIIRRAGIQPHPCYRAGWNRCSCMMCIFSKPCHWAGIKELFPQEVEAVKQDEKLLGFTLDNKMDLESYIGDAQSCVYHDNLAIGQLISGKYASDEIYTSDWHFPAGAFKGALGGPC